MDRQCKTAALQWQKIFFVTQIVHPTQKCQIEDDVLVLHRHAGLLGQRVQCARRKHEHLPRLRHH